MKEADTSADWGGTTVPETLHDSLVKIGFQQLKSDTSLYIYARDSLRIMVPVFIDEITIASPSVSASDQFVKELGQHFELRDLGPTSWLLGIQIIRDRPNCTLSLSQRQYIVDMLDSYGYTHCSPVQTPILPNTHLLTSDSPTTPEARAEMQNIPYINAVGALMYLAVSTRPDLAYTASLATSTSPSSEMFSTFSHADYGMDPRHWSIYWRLHCPCWY